MVFQLQYATAEERLAAQREQKNRYSRKPYECPNCEVIILLGNKWKHERTKKHKKSIEIPKTDELKIKKLFIKNKLLKITNREKNRKKKKNLKKNLEKKFKKFRKTLKKIKNVKKI